MKFFKLLYTLALLTIATTPSTASNKVDFVKTDWEGAVERALAEDKPIFLDGYASYCAPCKVMDEYVFQDSAVSELLNDNFISFKANIQTEEGKLLQFLYEIKALPDLIFVDPRGNVITRSEGGTGVDELMNLGYAALDLYREKSYKNYVPFEEEQMFVESSREERMVVESAGKSENSVFNTFLRTLPSSFNDDKMSIICRDMELYRANIGKDEVDYKVAQVIRNIMVESSLNNNMQDVNRIVKFMSKTNLDQKDNLGFHLKSLSYWSQGEWNKFAATVDKKVKSHYYVEIHTMEQAARAILLNTKKRKALRLAKKWMRYVNDYSPTSESRDIESQIKFSLAQR